MTIRHPAPLTPREMGDGLLLRQGKLEDIDKLAAFNARIHAETPQEAPLLEAWTRDLADGGHPSTHAGDFTVVEDTRSGEIVSTQVLISQTWTYAGIPFKVGRPELVGTDPAYRSRGLVRAQFNVMHDWSRARGEDALAITGIPYYYRQFGYEMALNLSGGRLGGPAEVPALPEGQAEKFTFRPADAGDAASLRSMMGAAGRSLVAAQLDDEWMTYAIQGMRPQNINRVAFEIILDEQGRPCGFFAAPPTLWGDRQAVTLFEVSGASWWEVTPAVIRRIFALGREHAAAENRECRGFYLHLGEEHPAYEVAGINATVSRRPYAFYMRVPDLPGFLNRMAPELERRLAASTFHGYSGELRISFYRSGLHLNFQEGRITTEAWNPLNSDQRAQCAFPDLTFLNLVFGRRSMVDLRAVFPDIWGDEKTQALVTALFPRVSSDVWPLS